MPRLLAFLVLLATVAAASGSEFRTITNREGKEIVAKLLQVHPKTVVIERKDGRTFEIALETLSDEDRERARLFHTQQVLGADPRVEVRIRRVRKGRHRVDEHSHLDPKLFFQQETEEFIYLITINNPSAVEVGPIEVGHQVFVQRARHGLGGMPPGLDRTRASEKVEKIPAGGEVTVETAPVKVVSVKRDVWRDRYRTSSNSPRRRVATSDDLVGAWVRLEAGGEVIREDSNPGGLPERLRW